MAILPRHLAGQPFRADRPILETLERPTFDTSAQQNALFDIAERLDQMGETAQLPVPPAGINADAGSGLSAIGSVLSGFSDIVGNIGALSKQQSAARQFRDEEEARGLFQQGMDDYAARREAEPDRPEKHPLFFSKAMQGIKRIVDRGDRFSKETQPGVRQVLRQQYLRAIPTVHADAIRAQRNQALSTLDTGLERAVEEQDEGRGLSLIGHLVDNGILSKQQGEERQVGFQTAFRAKGEQLAIDGAFHFARAGDLDGAREHLGQIDLKRRKQVEDDVLFTYRSMENERDVSGLIDKGKYRKAAVKLERRNPNGTYAHWRNLSDSRRDELLEQATGAYIDELKPVMVEALKRRREGSIETRPQLRRFFRERGQKLTPLFEEIAGLDLSGRFDTAAAKSSFFHRKIAGYEPDEDRGRVRYHNLLAALEVSGLPEGKTGTLAERLTRIADGDTEALEEQYTRREFDRRIAPAVRKTGGRVRADRVKRFDDPDRGTVYYTEPTDEERNDPAIAIESLRTRGFENEEIEPEEPANIPLVPEESVPPSPAPEALSNEETQLEPPESPLTEAEAGITVTNPDIPLSKPASPIEARVLQLSPEDQAILNGTLLGNEEVTDLIQWDREERMANFLQDKYVTGLQSGKYDSIEAAAKDMGRFLGKNPLDPETSTTHDQNTAITVPPNRTDGYADLRFADYANDTETNEDPYSLPDPENFYDPGNPLDEADKEALLMINNAAIGIIASLGEPGEDGFSPEEYREWATGNFESPSLFNGFNLSNETGRARRAYPGESDENIQLIESVKHNVRRARHLLPSSAVLSTTNWNSVDTNIHPKEKFNPQAPQNIDYYERLLSKISHNSVALDKERRELSQLDYATLSPRQKRRNGVIGFSLLSNGLQSDRAQQQIQKIMEAARALQLFYSIEGEVLDPTTLEVGSELYEAGRELHNTGKAAEIVASYAAGRVLEAGFSKILQKIAVSRVGVTPLIPKGLSRKEWRTLSNALKIHAGEFDGEILIQGSRASHKGGPGADIDIAIRVSEKQFDDLIKKAFRKPNPGSANWKTMQEAIRKERIFRRQLKLSGLGERLEKFLGVEPVQITVIKEGGKFDYGYMIPIEPKNSRF